MGGRIILRWIGMDWIHMTPDRDQCAHDNELSGSIKCWEYLSDWWVLKQDPAQWTSYPEARSLS
jgi:hypothetical protein